MKHTSEAKSVELASLMAAEFHELKNQLGHLTLTLGEVAMQHPELANPLHEPRLICQRIADRLVQALTLYKNDQNRLSLNIEAHSPIEFVEEVRAQATALAGANLNIVSHVEFTPPFWFFDRYLVEIALLNAVHNALQFAQSTIVIGVEPQEEGIRFYVRDDSDGYPEHILENQGQTPGKSSTGTGLGLFFAHTIAQAHENKQRKGYMSLHNDNGAVFSIWLP